ncbi:hypothetical protein PAHAL_5G511800 [Panicum hallii]|uniref:Sulfotransferase n=1 Tax=Panicum hallii TaxID=206008 RepID=A0A2S3HYR2_9POAL|nr:cytosolic sulfotransferase 5-like [Panicum hallii]PAN32777.1 hypothetical protein PAHAL_5G511800 [Panicum hallii]
MDSGAAHEEEDAAAQQQGAAPATAAPPSPPAQEEVAPALESLPLETRCPPFPLRQLNGFWLPEITLAAGVPALRARFTPRPTDVLLASFPKSGTTWLKALAFAARNRAAHPPSDPDRHPLRRSNPHDLVRFLEVEFALAGEHAGGALGDEFEALPSPRTLATHLPYSLLPERVRSECRIVYVCRDPKDALVSTWLFTRKAAPAFGADAEGFAFREAFELFCEGRSICGPQWRHVREYWEESVRRPGGVLFLRYEEMLLAPRSSLRKLAEFMGCGFSGEEEEEGGAVDAIVELCSLGGLKSAEVNRSGSGKLPIDNKAFFRKGGAGNWRNHMTPEMARRLDRIVDDALRGSGFAFAGSA